MARARLVVSDVSSEEVDQLRRTVNTLLLMLETAEASITAGASAEDVLNAWADAVRTATDDNPESIANITSTGREVVGLKPTPTLPRRVRQELRDMVADDDF
jgi:hypothetical protein